MQVIINGTAYDGRLGIYCSNITLNVNSNFFNTILTYEKFEYLYIIHNTQLDLSIYLGSQSYFYNNMAYSLHRSKYYDDFVY